ncbi:MAG: GNAT family protein [Proteobacteria bacterium]|nr:GNAT family protein [Pseudomonadota bacterium]
MALPTLPDDVLARRTQLPVKPAPVTLTGARVELRPLDLDADVAELHAISRGAANDVMWTWMSAGPFADVAALRAWLAAQVAAPDGQPFVVRELATGRLVGVANMMANVPAHLKVELGAIWYPPSAQGRGLSAEATFLLCAHAFGLGYRRVEWKCDARNEPSRRAARAYGFTFEGIQDAHLIIRGGNRDTAWFRMLDTEWTDRGPKLRAYAGTRTM